MQPKFADIEANWQNIRAAIAGDFSCITAAYRPRKSRTLNQDHYKWTMVVPSSMELQRSISEAEEYLGNNRRRKSGVNSMHEHGVTPSVSQISFSRIQQGCLRGTGQYFVLEEFSGSCRIISVVCEVERGRMLRVKWIPVLAGHVPGTR